MSVEPAERPAVDRAGGAECPAVDRAGEADRLPFPSAGLLDPPSRYAELRAVAPVVRVRTPVGDPAWLVVGHDAARRLFADPRLGRAHPDPERAPRLSASALNGGPISTFGTEPAEHARMRRLLVPSFSAKRMRLLAERVATLVDERVDALVAAHDAAPDGVVDLHEHLAFPLPMLVICELLGVPFADRDHFRDLSERAGDLTGGAAAARAFGEFVAYTAALAAAKRREPGEDVLTDLAAAPDLPSEELGRIAATVLFAGHDSTAVMIDLGVLMLLREPARRDAFVAGLPGSAAPTVEEMVRMITPATIGMLRYAREEIVLDDVRIAAGDAVVMCTAAADRDPAAHPDPDRFDPDRHPNTHLGFGHGPRFCLGASLARTELRAVLSALFTRLPGLRLAVDERDLPVRTGLATGGVRALPVTW